MVQYWPAALPPPPPNGMVVTSGPTAASILAIDIPNRIKDLHFAEVRQILLNPWCGGFYFSDDCQLIQIVPSASPCGISCLPLKSFSSSAVVWVVGTCTIPVPVGIFEICNIDKQLQFANRD